MMPRVLIAGDRPLVRMGLAAVLAGDTTVRCQGAISVALLASRLATKPLDVLLLDLDDLSVPALSLIAQVRHAHPSVMLAVCTDGVAFAPELLQAGVGGILTPAEAPDLLLSAVHMIRAGQCFLSPVVATALLRMDRRCLTRAELRIVALLARGLSTVEIAHEVSLDPRSVQNYITVLRRKLGCRERVQLAAWYWRYVQVGAGLVEHQIGGVA